MAINVGIVFGFLSGLIFYNVDESIEWRLMFGMGAILPVIMIIVSEFVMAESPRWLVSKGRHEEAKIILQKIYPEGRHSCGTLGSRFASKPTGISSHSFFLESQVSTSTLSKSRSSRVWNEIELQKASAGA